MLSVAKLRILFDANDNDVQSTHLSYIVSLFVLYVVNCGMILLAYLYSALSRYLDTL